MKSNDLLRKRIDEEPWFIARLTNKELTDWAASGAFKGFTPAAFLAIFSS